MAGEMQRVAVVTGASSGIGLAATAPQGTVRVINTSSDGSEMIPGLNLDDMQNLDSYSNGLAYCSGKLANVLLARALARRLKNVQSLRQTRFTLSSR